MPIYSSFVYFPKNAKLDYDYVVAVDGLGQEAEILAQNGGELEGRKI